MATVKINYATATAFPNAAGLNSAAAASYVSLGTIDNTTNLYLDYLIEVGVTPSAAPTGNTQIVLFASDSVDGTDFSDTPGGASIPDANVALVGAFQVSAAVAYRSRAFSLAAAFGGNLPPKCALYAKIDDGVALAATGNSAQYIGVDQTLA